jgi:hypothetical protein
MSSSLPDRCLQQIHELQQQDQLHPQNARPLAMHPDKHDNTVPNALEYLRVFLETSVLPVELHDKQKPDFLLYQAKFLMGCSDRGTIRNRTGVQPPDFSKAIFKTSNLA